MKTRIQIIFSHDNPLNLNFDTEEETKQNYTKLKEAAIGKLTVSITAPDVTINMAEFLWMGIVDV